MRVGIFVSECWGPASTAREVESRAQAAEALGYSTGWVPYLPWSLDALTSLQAAGAVTNEIELGTAVLPTYLFHPLALARQTATVQAAIGRPIHLGIGCSNPAVIQMHGLPFERPARHVREYLGVLAAAFEVGADPKGDREQAGFVQTDAGEFFHVNSVYGTPGGARPASVLVGALGPHMLGVTGAHSDGVLATWADERVIERDIAPAVRSAARRAGRPAPIVGGVLATAIVPKSRVAAARDAAQALFGFYQTTMPYQRVVEASGRARIAEIALIGDEDEVASRLEAFERAGQTDLLVAPLDVEGATWQSTAERLRALS